MQHAQMVTFSNYKQKTFKKKLDSEQDLCFLKKR